MVHSRKIHLGILLAFMFVGTQAGAQIVFQDNFDGHGDWASPQQDLAAGSDRSYSSNSSSTACSVCPTGEPKWSGFYNQRAAWPDWAGQPLARIDSSNARGGGKGLTFFQEPIDSSSCDGGTYWCSGGILSLILPQSYNELYVRFFIKFQPGWVWDDNPSSGALEKFLRISHYHQPPSTLYSFGTAPNGSHHPVAYWDISYYVNAGGGDQMLNSFQPRYSATFNPASATPAGFYNEDVPTGKRWVEYLGDGNWHCIEMHVKGNTAGGYYPGTPNGEWDFWVDGQRLYSKRNMAWADAASSNNTWSPTPFLGWNHVAIGGNAYNRYYSPSTHTEQWYAIDDLVISTTYVGPGTMLQPPGTLDSRQK